MAIEFFLNGEKVIYEGSPLRRLIDVLRDDFGLTGVKEGCGEGECGACSVLLDGKNVPSCILPVGYVEGREVYTIEGLRDTEQFRVLTDCFAEAGAVQCGFCTPGMMIAAVSLLKHNPAPTEEEIRDWLAGNLCRCTGFNMIVEAVKLAAERGIRW